MVLGAERGGLCGLLLSSADRTDRVPLTETGFEGSPDQSFELHKRSTASTAEIHRIRHCLPPIFQQVCVCLSSGFTSADVLP